MDFTVETVPKANKEISRVGHQDRCKKPRARTAKKQSHQLADQKANHSTSEGFHAKYSQRNRANWKSVRKIAKREIKLKAYKLQKV